MKRSEYEKELRKLQVELCHLQQWVKEKQQRIVIVLEGRDGAGKGGTIKALTERVARVDAVLEQVHLVMGLPGVPDAAPELLDGPLAGELIAGVVATYRTRSAIRDVGKALAVPESLVDAFAKDHFWFDERGLAVGPRVIPFYAG